MHQALYRKWRPRTFDDVCGQEHITSVLRYEVKENALSHAYLFCGSRGTGKTTCAKILAKAVNCLSPINGSPCCKCAACLSVENGSATDVLEMDAASNNGVEDIRDIRDEVNYSPSALRYRVYIVDEVHMLSTNAFNALLKTLEEPPAHVIFILATTELQKLPATIISRCQRFDFRRISLPTLTARISHIANAEGISLAPDAAERIAKLAQGGMRDAISLLELCASGGKAIDRETVDEMMGSAGREKMLSLISAIATADYAKIFDIVNDAVAAARDLSVFWQDLIGVYRDLLVIKTTQNATRYLDLTDAETAELGALAKQFSRERLLFQCRLVEDAMLAMQQANAIKRIVAEMTLVRLCDPRLDTSPEGLLARLERLEARVAAGVPAPQRSEADETPTAKKESPAPITVQPREAIKAEATVTPTPAPEAPAPVQKNAPAPAPASAQKAASQQTLAKTGGRVLTKLRGFANCVERLSRENAMVASFLDGVRAYLDEQKRVVLILPSTFNEMMLEDGDRRDALRAALSAELSREIRDRDLLFEVASPAHKNDTVIDDILSAAEADGN